MQKNIMLFVLRIHIHPNIYRSQHQRRNIIAQTSIKIEKDTNFTKTRLKGFSIWPIQSTSICWAIAKIKGEEKVSYQFRTLNSRSFKCYQDITIVTTSLGDLIFIRNIIKKKSATKHSSTDNTDGIMCESKEHTGRYFRQSQSSKVNKYKSFCVLYSSES